MVEKKSTTQIPPKREGLSVTRLSTFKAELRPCRTVYLILQMKSQKISLDMLNQFQIFRLNILKQLRW